MKTILRFLVAIIFIASGLVKAIDVVGFSFKLEEYFSPTVFNLPFLESLALLIAIFVVALEIILGFTLLLKIGVKKTLGAMIALCVFFAFLTFYSAYFDKVTDCGCFGDAIKFTPWQSFIKDIVLLVALLILWVFYKNESESEDVESSRKMILGLSIVATAFIIFWGWFYEPLVDFRDYKIGTNLNTERQKIAANPSEFKTFYSLKNKKTNEIKEVNQDDYVADSQYWKEGTDWEIDSDKTTSKMVKQGYKSEITKFKIDDENGVDITEDILKAPKAILVFCYKPKTADAEVLKKIDEQVSQIKDAKVIGVSTQPGTFKKLPNASMDMTASKTIARSNPFVLVLENGKIVEKLPAKMYIK